MRRRRVTRTHSVDQFARRRDGIVIIVAILAVAAVTTSAAARSAPTTAAGGSAKAERAGKSLPRKKSTVRARARLKSSGRVDRYAPKRPPRLSAAAQSQTSITLSWAPSQDNVGVVGYGTYLNNLRVGTTTIRSFTYSQLLCGTTYSLGVDAFDAARNRSAISVVLAATAPCLDQTAPSAPGYLRQTSGGQIGLSLEWGAAVDNVGVAGYSVYRDGVPVGITQQTSMWLSNLVCGAGHSVAVEAYDAAGNRSGRATTFVTTDACADTTPPSIPAGLSVWDSGESSVSVSWRPADDDRGVTGYRTYLNGVDAGTTSVRTKTFAELACGVSYVVEVVAFDAAGNLSRAASVVAPTAPCPPPPGTRDTEPPTAPTGLARSGGSAVSVTVAWAASTDNVGVVGYGIYRNGTKISDSYTTAYIFNGLTCATSYDLGVDVFDATGNRSARVTLPSRTNACADSEPPSPPTDLARISRTETSITLSWHAASDNVGVVGYRTFRGGTQIGSTASTSYAVTGLACGTTYTLGVEAYDADGNQSSRPATMLSTSACSDTVAPSNPTAVQQTVAANTSLSVRWAAASDNVGVAGYTLYVGGTAIGTTSQTSYSFSGLSCGTSYTIAVDAYDAAGNRSQPVSLSAATAACGVNLPPPPPPPAGSLYVSTTGSDSNPCTQAQPCLSFGRAYKAAAPGARVFVAAGTYPAQEISEDMTKLSGPAVVFMPTGGAVTVNGVLDFGQDQYNRRGPRYVTVKDMKIQYLRSWAGSANLTWENIDAAHFDVLDSTNVYIRGGDFGPCQAPRDDPACVSRIAGTSSNVVVDGASIHDVTSTDLVNYHVDGMFIRGGTNIVVRNTKFWGNMITNIRVQDQACCKNANLLIENNWFNVPLQGDGVSPRSDAINIDTPVTGGVTIQFNSFAENAGPQVVAPATVKGNLMQNMSCASGVSYAYNVFIPFSAYTGQTPCGSTDKKATSFGYMANGSGSGFDYRLASVTAGVDYVPTSAGCPGVDFEGTARPQGGACDVGSDER